MKKSLNIFVLAVVFMLAQACGSKSEKNSEESVATETPAVKTVVLTVAEKRAKIEEQRIARAEKRRLEFEERAKTTPMYTDSEGHVIYYKAELGPVFVGGEKAMMEYLRENIKFPKEAQDSGDEGTVFVDFIVAADGSVREAEVTDSTGEEVVQSFRDEAIRVVTSMPKWIPGRQRGKAVDVKFSLPITFQMI